MFFIHRQRDVAFAGYGVTLAGDFPARQMLDSIPNVDPERKARIIDVLDIDPEWRMHQVSDGQRRRVQLAYGLMIPYSVSFFLNHRTRYEQLV